MHKAYDRVERVFLEKIMLKMGFDARWVALIMSCVTSVRYTAQFNSMETDIFHLPGGLDKGIPCPLIFSFLLQKAYRV